MPKPAIHTSVSPPVDLFPCNLEFSVYFLISRVFLIFMYFFHLTALTFFTSLLVFFGCRVGTTLGSSQKLFLALSWGVTPGSTLRQFAMLVLNWGQPHALSPATSLMLLKQGLPLVILVGTRFTFTNIWLCAMDMMVDSVLWGHTSYISFTLILRWDWGVYGTGNETRLCMC